MSFKVNVKLPKGWSTKLSKVATSLVASICTGLRILRKLKRIVFRLMHNHRDTYTQQILSRLIVWSQSVTISSPQIEAKFQTIATRHRQKACI